MELVKLPNIGKKLSNDLVYVGITTVDEFHKVGSREAWRLILEKDPSAWTLRLFALEGAIQGVSLQSIDEETKSSLKEYVALLKPSKKAAKNIH